MRRYFQLRLRLTIASNRQASSARGAFQTKLPINNRFNTSRSVKRRSFTTSAPCNHDANYKGNIFFPKTLKRYNL